ncbi:hypothetical protein ACN077_09405 [Clostridium chromiireducens]|uniref:hypothetical protein n=1 Tax=Clostridium chromiireducens TaxID=225345 RepID=UPI003AF86833
MNLKNSRYRHMPKKENFITINNKYNFERDKASEIKNIYIIVKKQYINRLESNALDIALERIYLNKKLDEYTGETLKYWMKILFIVMTVYITATINQGIALQRDKIGILFTEFLILLVLTVLIFRRNIKREVNEHTYYKICLTVLDELEKENKVVIEYSNSGHTLINCK